MEWSYNFMLLVLQYERAKRLAQDQLATVLTKNLRPVSYSA